MRIFWFGCKHCDHMVDDPNCKRNVLSTDKWNPLNKHAWECCKCLRIKSI